MFVIQQTFDNNKSIIRYVLAAIKYYLYARLSCLLWSECNKGTYVLCKGLPYRAYKKYKRTAAVAFS